MSLPVWIGIALLGGLGACARFAVDLLITFRERGTFPLGTFAVNLSGTFALGALAGVAAGEDLTRLLGAGLLGGFTTFSTWMLQSQRLAEDGEGGSALLNLILSAALGLAAVWVGMQTGEAIGP